MGRADGSAADIATLQRERDEAVAHARVLEQHVGELRGEVKRLERALWRRTARRRRFAAFGRRIRSSLRR